MHDFTPKERMMAALNLEEPDTVPVAPYVDLCYAPKLLGLKISDYSLGSNKLRAKILLAAQKRHGYDWILVFYENPKDWLENARIEQHDDRYIVIEEKKRVHGDIHTCMVYPKDDPPHYTFANLRLEYAIDELSEGFRDHEEILRSGQCEVIEILSKKVGNEVLITGTGIGGAFGSACMLVGLEQMMLALYKKPNLVKKLLRLLVRQRGEYGKALVEAGAQALWLEEVFAGTDVISPKHYEEFALPYERSQIRELKRLGVPVILYFCGNPMLLLDKIVKTEADCYAFEESKKGFNIDIVKVKEVVRDRACSFGNFDAISTLRGDIKNIEDNVNELIKNAAYGGGFILGTGSPVMKDVSPLNLDFMINVARKRGRYPMRRMP